MKHFKETGDTLIEVLLALAIVGMVLGVAYGSASRSVRVGRLAQERTEATKLAESQIERMKAMTTQVNSGGLFTDPPVNGFCIDAGLAKQADNNAACTLGFYNISNEYDPASHVVRIHITWEQEGGNSGGTRPEVLMLYKLYQ